MKTTVVVALCMISVPMLAYAHNGGLDSNGCHNNKGKGVYECHQGALQGQSFKSKAEADARLTAANKSGGKPAQQTAKVPEAGKTKTPETGTKH
ncbi:MAG: YHYH domain-containing protein [Bacteroidota bacterium]